MWWSFDNALYVYQKLPNYFAFSIGKPLEGNTGIRVAQGGTIFIPYKMEAEARKSPRLIGDVVHL
jgi:hypothetical protein